MQSPAEDYELEPDFAVVCSFLENFAEHFGKEYSNLTVEDFKSFLEAEQGRITIKCITHTPHMFLMLIFHYFSDF